MNDIKNITDTTFKRELDRLRGFVRDDIYVLGENFLQECDAGRFEVELRSFVTALENHLMRRFDTTEERLQDCCGSKIKNAPTSESDTWFYRFTGIEWTGENIAEVTRFLKYADCSGEGEPGMGLRFSGGMWYLEINDHIVKRLDKGDVISIKGGVFPAHSSYREYRSNETETER